MALTRSPENPILTREDVPDVPPEIVDATSVFNPGAVLHEGRYLLMLRVQTRGRETFFMTAESDDGTRFEVSPRIVRIQGIDSAAGTVYHSYDPRITKLGDIYYIMFAMDTDAGCRLGLARTTDFETVDFMGATGTDDIRNGVLFPERIGGQYARLDRPNRARFGSGVTSGDGIALSRSDDLIDWRPVAQIMQGRPHYWDELIGPGPPPVKTREGWLLVYHGIATHLSGACIYQAGVALLALDDPTKVLARSRNNILEPREPYELTGQVPNVVFPSGMVVEGYDEQGFADPDSKTLVYYGAADTSIGLATATVGELLAACSD
ncbi:MAG: glycoside hydrolase family 130 protein [Candidatus Eisenbacteria sp.]|nr:glycoside hydrolase family 130 protein [Candidatus Eisenbacteria bacterium]